MTFALFLFCVMCSSDSEASEPIVIDGIEYVIDGDHAKVTRSELTYVFVESSIEYEDNDYPVTEIASDAFANSSSLYILHIPESVAIIGSNIVVGCTSLSYILMDETVLPEMETNSLSVEYYCTIYCAFPITEVQLRSYIGSSDEGYYTLINEKAAVVNYKDTLHGVDNYSITTINSNITIDCDIPCSHCSLVSWTDGENAPCSNGSSYTVTNYMTVLRPILNQPTNTYYYYVDDELYGTRTVSYHAQDPNLQNPIKEGHSFIEWQGHTLTGGDMRFDALWNVLSYYVYFDTTGGSTLDPILVQYGSAITITDEPTKTGHSFGGWTPEVPDKMGSANITLTASWILLSYELKFIDRGDETTDTVAYGSPITVPEFVREGYHYSLDGTLEETMPDHDLCYSVIWIPNQYRISFYDGQDKISDYVGDYESPIEFPSPSKVGYHPDWGTITTVPAQDISVYVTWVINQHTVSYVLPGGNVEHILDYGSSIVPPSPGYNEGYYFEAWTPSIPDVMPDTDIMIESVWLPTVKSRTGAEAGHFIAGSGDSVIVSVSDLSAYANVTLGVEGKWTMSFDPSFVGGMGNLKLTVTEVSPDLRPNAPKGTKALYLIEMEDDGTPITSLPAAATVTIPIDPSGRDPFVSIMTDDEPQSAADVSYSDGKMSFSTSSLSYMAAGFTGEPGDAFPTTAVIVVSVVMVAISAVAAVYLYRRERKV